MLESFLFNILFSMLFTLLFVSLNYAYVHIFVQVTLPSPVLNESELESLFKDPYLKAQTIPTFFDIRKGLDGSLEKTLNKICEAADEAVRNGCQLLVLSDRTDELVSTVCVHVVEVEI